MKIVDINGVKRDCLKIFEDPDYPGFFRVEFEKNGRSHHEWYPVEEFLKLNPDLENLNKETKPLAEDDLGVVSTASSITLTDKSKRWDKNSYVGFPAWISRGKGEGQVRKVVSNTKDTIILDEEWAETPNKTSQYVLSRHIHNIKIIENSLPGVENLIKNVKLENIKQ